MFRVHTQGRSRSESARSSGGCATSPSRDLRTRVDPVSNHVRHDASSFVGARPALARCAPAPARAPAAPARPARARAPPIQSRRLAPRSRVAAVLFSPPVSPPTPSPRPSSPPPPPRLLRPSGAPPPHHRPPPAVVVAAMKVGRTRTWRLQAGYLFPEINPIKQAHPAENPDANIISLGIGDTTEPIPAPIIAGMVSMRRSRHARGLRQVRRLRRGGGRAPPARADGFHARRRASPPTRSSSPRPARHLPPSDAVGPAHWRCRTPRTWRTGLVRDERPDDRLPTTPRSSTATPRTSRAARRTTSSRTRPREGRTSSSSAPRTTPRERRRPGSAGGAGRARQGDGLHHAHDATTHLHLRPGGPRTTYEIRAGSAASDVPFSKYAGFTHRGWVTVSPRRSSRTGERPRGLEPPHEHAAPNGVNVAQAGGLACLSDEGMGDD